ncbi:MAG: hypothetical protein QME92_11020 [Bacillota bacterium]|nr:hypothetical protein [Bacillota bacterium]
MARADGVRTAGCAVMDSVEKVIVGKRDVVRLLLAALLADGEEVVEDIIRSVPVPVEGPA